LSTYRIILILCLFQFVSCSSADLKTVITEKPLAIDTSDFNLINEKFHYENIKLPRKYLGGLVPRIPMVEVSSFDFKGNCIWQSKGMLLTCNNLIIKSNDSLILVDTEEKFKKIYAPIDNEQEAISYVSYLTGTYPEYDIPKKSRYRIFSDDFPSTYSKKIIGGFEVILHDKDVFGCGPHTNYYKIFTVTTEGHIKLLKTFKMFEDPEEDGLCVD
jgi:hypothetical protein